ncbi:MAG: hypothetical protein F6K10_18325 [Moorea sp. SIO2B7]|nr:hypothetical protein [Moorena sp. SIO2B7]
MLENKVKETIRDGASKLNGPEKRAFMARVTQDYFEGSARKAKTYLGWNTYTVKRGIQELEKGIVCVDNYQARGRKKTSEILPNLEADIRNLVDGSAQAAPKLKSTFSYTKISGRAVREKLITEKGYTDEQLPCRQTIGTILKRIGYRLKKHKK